MNELGQRIQAVLRARYTELAPRLYWQNPLPYAGLCYVASEAYYHLAGGKAAGLTPQVARVKGGTHWWLKTTEGAVIDLTAAQFAEPVDYAAGRGCGFLTKEPSKRARLVLAWVEGGI